MKKSLPLIMMLIASPGLAFTGTEQAGEKAETKVEKKICKTDRATGSRTRVNRICMTQAEWDEAQADLRKGLNDLSRNSGRSGSTPQ